ncbi:MAG: diguanylate cyclase [Rhodocyclaceae bacterium]|nr:diguanylate cyclase [Rhodocyclaceae bacterium]
MSITRTPTPGRHRAFVLGAWLLLGLACYALVAIELGRIQQAALRAARERGATLVGMVAAVHEWNARIDGGHAASGGTTALPAPAAAPQRTTPTTAGHPPTAAAPPFTTTDIARRLVDGSGARVRLFGLATRHPRDAADATAQAAIQAFAESGADARVELIEEQGAPAYRYYAPLRVGERCLGCHGAEGYAVGEVRGVVDLSISAHEAQARAAADARATVLGGLIGFLLLGSVGHVFLQRQRAMLQRLSVVAQSRADEVAVRSSELARQRERYQTVAELSSDWFWEQDEQFRFVAFSGDHYSKGALPTDQMLGKTRWELDLLGVSADEIAHHRSIVEGHREFVGFEYQLVNCNKELRWYSVSGRPQFDARGAFIGYIGTGVDVTTRKRREQMLQTLTGETAAVFGAAFFEALAESLRKLLDARYCLVSRLPEHSSLARVVTLSDAAGELTLSEFPIEDSPCSWVLDGDICIFPDSADQAFPKSALLRELGATSYVGVPIGAAGARPLGILAVMDPGPLRLERDLTELVRIFAARAMLEFERMDAEHALREGARLLNLAEKMAHVGSWEFDIGNRLLLWSQETYRIFGVDRRTFDCNFDNYLACVHPDDRALVRETFAASVANGNAFELEHRILLADGSVRTVLKRGEIRVGDDGRPASVQGMMQDISEQRESEQKLMLAASVFSAAHDGVLITDPDGSIIDANPSICLASGYQYQELVGSNPRIFQSGRQDRDFYRDLWQTLAKHGYWEGEIWNRRKEGQLVPERVSISAVCDDRGGVTHYIGVYTDISELKAHQRELERQANNDPLTGLPNRRLLMDRIKLALAQAKRAGNRPAVAFVDLDGFKPVNDRFGHDAGDELLIEVARRLSHAVRAGDTVARLGGDEFVLLLVGMTSAQEIETTLDRVLAQIRRPVSISGSDISLSASIGVALYPRDGTDPEALLQHADAAMYAAKHGGRDRYNPFREGLVES